MQFTVSDSRSLIRIQIQTFCTNVDLDAVLASDPDLGTIKGEGIFSTYYTYITVFIRNAANLTLLLLKGSKLRKGNKN
jgi:hypothetical protein